MLDCARMPTESLLSGLARRIEAHTGLAFPPSKWRDLSRALDYMAEEAGFENAGTCAAWLREGAWDKRKAALCARHLVIRETYFFREPRAFQLVSDYVRDKLGQEGGDRQLRIWSAGCCTGEEAYSIAISLLTAMPGLPADAVHILATDLDAGNLRTAERGVYRQWSFRTISAQAAGAIPPRRLLVQRQHFVEAGERQWRVGEAARRMVRFAELNLAQPVYPAGATGTEAIDIIFCRNVLMYFSQEQAQKVIARFRECLVDGGWLIVSPGEASAALFEGFSAVCHPDAIYFRKTFPAAPAAPHAFAMPVMPATPAMSVAGPPPVFRPLPHQTDVPAFAAPAHAHAAKDAQHYHARALAAIESGDQRAAIENLKRLAYLEPDCILAHYLMGVALAADNRHREARRRLHTAAELLSAFDDSAIVPRSDGMPAAALAQAVQAQLVNLARLRQ